MRLGVKWNLCDFHSFLAWGLPGLLWVSSSFLNRRRQQQGKLLHRLKRVLLEACCGIRAKVGASCCVAVRSFLSYLGGWEGPGAGGAPGPSQRWGRLSPPQERSLGF